jgi:hypothetical protein
MKKLFFLYFLATAFGLSSQTLDDFSDGDFTTNPAWSGSTSDFTVVTNQLRSNSTTASTSFYLSTPATLVNNCQWEFWCNLQFNTSSLNYVDVYLLADQSNLSSGTLNGYFVRIGNTLDEVCLYKNTAGTVTKIIDGADGTTNQSNTLLKVKVVRDASNQFTLSTDFTGTGSGYGVEGSVTDNTFLSSAAFGLLVKQSTASFFQKHFFDDFYAGAIVLDVTPPVVNNATVISSTQLDVLFNENVDLASSQTSANYSVNNGIGAPSSAVRDGSNLSLVHLTFATAFSNGLSNTITVNGVQDVAGNAISNGTANFVFYNLSTPSYKEVIVNEIMADANPAVGTLPLFEFVEVYNTTSAKTFDLGSWTFSDASTTATLGSKYLLPGQYMILCKYADTSLFSPFGNVTGMSTMPSLNDAGDKLYLKDNSGIVIDSVNYDISWYNDNTKDGGGWTLELINPSLSLNCSAASNWSASNDPNGGTPGQQNSIYSLAPDVTGPVTTQVSVTDSLHITVCFSEVIDAAQVNTLSNYTVNNGIGTPAVVQVSGTDARCVEVTLANALQNQVNYTITFSNLADCSGNVISPSTFNFSFYVPGFNDVIVNEIMADPDPPIALPDYEYVELYNRTAYSVSLKNWTIGTATSTKIIPDIVILPDSFVVLTGSSGFAAYTGFNLPVYEVTSFPALTNTGSQITLKNSSGKIINSVSYTDGWYQDAAKSEGGFSLELLDPVNPCAEEANWRASNSVAGGTPGKINSVYASNPDNTAPVLERIVVLSADTIQLFFSEKTDSSSLLSSAAYSIDNSVGNPVSVIPVANDFKSVLLVLPVQLQQGIIYSCVVISSIKDCAGNLVSASGNSARFALPQPASPGDIVINELLFDPKTGGVDFVELYNNSAKPIDLGTLNIGELDTLTNTFSDNELITTEGYLFFPGEYLVLSESGSIVKSQYTTTNPDAFLDMPALPAMNTTDDVVVIYDAAGIIIDKVIYTDDMHFDLLNDTKGVSLERIDFSRPSSDLTNWNSAASSVGFATPGYRNSQYLVAETGSNVTVSPETFSPDNDGYEDVLNISYTFETAGQVANVSVYDASGRLVRRLLKSETLGSGGTVSWNGLNDVNEKAPIGIYVIYFETFEAAGKVHKYKRSCVLAGKL